MFSTYLTQITAKHHCIYFRGPSSEAGGTLLYMLGLLLLGVQAAKL
uniref:Uncharacterized protein n=1 Tax=Anguilla anguilla TaxID=7936 RepID=A0A0E9UWG5_ANGAN